MSPDEGPPPDPSPSAAVPPPDRAPRIETLSPRRREILEHIARGLTNEQIAENLAISPATVRTHITALLSHLGLRNRTEATALLLSQRGTTLVPLPEIPAVLARPAIAVLPTMSSDSPEPAALASAITQELCALLSRWCWFPVIARSSTATARELGLSARALGEALGARFLVDPTLRAAAKGWRLTVEVADTLEGHTLWTERYDFSDAPPEVMDTLDALVAEVVARAYPVLVAHVAATPLRHDLHPHPDATAWQLAHRAIDLQARRDHASNTAALDLCARALDRDPSLTLAWFARGLCAYDAILNQWETPEAGRQHLLAAADGCLRLAPHAAEGYFLLGRYHQTLGDHQSAITALETAVTHNPSFAAAHALLAQAHMLCGQTDLALTRMQHALRLGPRSFVAGLATLHFAAGRYAEATAGAEQAIAIAPRYPFARALAAAAAYHGGELGRAREHLRLLREAFPGFDPKGFLSTFGADVPAVASLTSAIDSLDTLDVIEAPG